MSTPVFTKTATGDGTVYDGPVRVRHLFVHTATSGSPALTLHDSSSATTISLLTLSFIANEAVDVNIPDNGIRFTQKVFADLTAIKRVTFYLS